MTVTTLSECTTADYWQYNWQVSQKTLVLTAGFQVKCSMFVGQPACGYWPPVSGGAELQCSRVRRGLNSQHPDLGPAVVTSPVCTMDTWHVTRDSAWHGHQLAPQPHIQGQGKHQRRNNCQESCRTVAKYVNLSPSTDQIRFLQWVQDISTSGVLLHQCQC